MKPLVEGTHVAEGGVGDQVEVVDGGQEALQLAEDGAQAAYHVRQDGGHLKHEAHDALQLLRHHQLESARPDQREEVIDTFSLFC